MAFYEYEDPYLNRHIFYLELVEYIIAENMCPLQYELCLKALKIIVTYFVIYFYNVFFS